MRSTEVLQINTPPFQPSALSAAYADRCCAPPQPLPPAAARRPQRERLAALDPHFHCSVIGTCLPTAELRRLVPRHKDIDRDRASDLELHHAAVQLAGEDGAGAKALHKLLDERHAAAIRRQAGCDSAEALAELWREALRSGEIPGAYWALMTHPLATRALRNQAFGEVHMLSHLVGAANRADIRRLVALEQENAELREQVERQQNRLREVHVERHETVGHLSRQLVELTARLQREPAGGGAAAATELTLLRHRLHEREQQVALQTSRREQAEQTAAATAQKAERLGAELEGAVALLESLHGELHSLERQLAAQAGDELRPMAAWSGRRVLYVGGRPSSNATLRELCRRAGIELVLHDGGIEDRKGLLAAAVPGSDVVLFPVDCVDHDSMSRLKRLCAQHGVPYKPLRTAGVASVVAALSG